MKTIERIVVGLVLGITMSSFVIASEVWISSSLNGMMFQYDANVMCSMSLSLSI